VPTELSAIESNVGRADIRVTPAEASFRDWDKCLGDGCRTAVHSHCHRQRQNSRRPVRSSVGRKRTIAHVGAEVGFKRRLYQLKSRIRWWVQSGGCAPPQPSELTILSSQSNASERTADDKCNRIVSKLVVSRPRPEPAISPRLSVLDRRKATRSANLTS
jgi:hypothetical protein